MRQAFAELQALRDAAAKTHALREGLQVIGEESDRLNGLINNLLDASRIQAGGFKLERGDVALPKLAASVVESFRPGVMDKLGLSFEALSALNPGLVYCAISGYGSKSFSGSIPAAWTISRGT